MILLIKTPEEQECASCPQCGTKLFITCTPIIDTLAKLQLLLDGSLNTCACDACGQSVRAEDPVWVNMEKHGIAPLFYVPLDYFEHEHVDPTVLSAREILTGSSILSTNSLGKCVRVSKFNCCR